MQCAIYCRLSREDEEKTQAESESIQNQKSMLLRYAAEQGWEVYRVYCDEDYSGADHLRPDFNRMLRDAEARRFQMILCKTQSRFTRDMELVEKYIHGKFPLWGIRFVAIADHVDTDVRGNKKARQINGLINEWYLEDLSENIRMVLDDKRRQGQYIGAVPVYGYRKDPRDHNHLVIDGETAPVVRQIFAWYLAGSSTGDIAERLNEGGAASPGSRRGKTAAAKWSRQAISRILRNEMYTGVMVQGRKRRVSYKSRQCVDVPEEAWFRVAGTHEAIIDPETFQTVQRLMAPRVKTDGRGEIHPLAGLVRCADCGSTMAKTSNGRQGERRVCYLRCQGSVGAGALCTRHSVRLDPLVELVSDRLRRQLASVQGEIRWRDGRRAAQSALLQRELQMVESRMETRAAALERLYLDRVSGAVEEELFTRMNRDFQAERERMAARRSALCRELEMLEERKDSGGGREDAPLPRELLVLAIERIEIGERDPASGRQDVRIFWKF